MESMRDALFNCLFSEALNDPSIMVLAADFSAPSFDRWRAELPEQFLNTGISEQNTILVASGLALSGFKVFVVSIAPFITKRCLEQISLYPADLNLNVAIAGVGAGLSYSEAGATHHALDDIAIMGMLPHMRILSPSDNSQLKAMTGRILKTGGPYYLRLDRRSLPGLYKSGQTFGRSLEALDRNPRINFLATGYMTHVAKRLAGELKELKLPVGVIDAFSLPLDPEEFCDIFQGTEMIISLEEHVPTGGLGACAQEMTRAMDAAPELRVFALNIKRGFCHSYGPREIMQARHGLDQRQIKKTVENFYKVQS